MGYKIIILFGDGALSSRAPEDRGRWRDQGARERSQLAAFVSDQQRFRGSEWIEDGGEGGREGRLMLSGGKLGLEGEMSGGGQPSGGGEEKAGGGDKDGR